MKKHSTKIRVDVREKIHEIAKMYFEGKNSYELAELFQCSRCVITTTLKKFGYKLRSPHARKGCKSWNKGKEYLQIKGEKNPRWKGGITPLNQKIRHCLQYKTWIKEIFSRDNFTCVLCKDKKGGNLEADHFPIPFCQILVDFQIKSLEEAQQCKLLWDTSNGRTVCMKCHNRGNIRPVRSRFKKVHSNKL